MRFLLQLFSSRKTVEEDLFAISVENLIGFKPVNISLYSLAFRHKSADLNKNGTQSNERLEFLGDAILSAVVAERLYIQYPNENEGFLTSMRSKIVSRNNLNQIAHKLEISGFIVANLDIRKKAKSITGDTLEALLGAIYLDLGMNAASAFIETKILANPVSIRAFEKHVISYKSKLLEWSQKERKSLSFILLNSWGSDHNKTFEMGVMLNNELIGSGIGGSKKLAEEVAAQTIYEELRIES